MTNKSMLIVERELLERLFRVGLNAVGFGCKTPAEELRALLDNPAPVDDRAGSLVPEELVELLRADLRQEVESARLSLAAQHQGEPVAYMAKRKTPTGNARLDRPLLSLVGEDGWGPAFECVPLYAEPPAPVAVMMPERMYSDSLPSWAEEQKLVRGWNACLEEVARLNGVKQ